ncbi:MAG: carboxypeptidase-like regulatory domain-containing protein [Myxococcales bacterium]
MPGRSRAITIAMLASVAGACAFAESEARAGEVDAHTLVEHQDLPKARIDLGYALSFRNDSQNAQQVDVSAKGLAPSHLRLDGAVWFGNLPLGLALRANWERFALKGADFAGNDVSFGVDSYLVGGGLATRFDVYRGWAFEGALGYQYAALPVVDAGGSGTSAMSKGEVSTHGPMLAVRFGLPHGSWILPDVHVSAVPYAMSKTPSGSSSGWVVDAGVGVGLGGLSLGGFEWSAVLGYDFSTTQVNGGGGQYIQRAHRASLGLRLSIPGNTSMVEPQRPTGPGRILGRLLDPDGNPLAKHDVRVEGLPEPLTTRSDGTFVLKKAGPGPVSLRAEGPGLKAAAKTVEVAPETDVSVELQLARPTGPGTIRGVVYDKPSDPTKRVALAKAVIEVAGKTYEADGGGAFAIAGVGPGLVQLKLSAAGFVSGDEVVQVPAESEAKVELSLVREKAKPLATLRGLVRGPGGKPLAAKLAIPEAKIASETNAAGEFKFQLPGGRYKVQIDAPGYIAQTKVVQVADGDQAIFNIDMHPTR